MLYLEDVPYTALTDPIESDRLLSRESLTVDGHEATRVEYEANDDGIVPEHTRITSYYVDLESEGRSLVANTMDYTTIDYPRATRVLDLRPAPGELLADPRRKEARDALAATYVFELVLQGTQ